MQKLWFLQISMQVELAQPIFGFNPGRKFAKRVNPRLYIPASLKINQLSH